MSPPTAWKPPSAHVPGAQRPLPAPRARTGSPRRRLLLAGGVGAWLLAGCGGGSERPPPEGVDDEPSGPGRLVEATRVATLTRDAIQAAAAPLADRVPGLQPRYGVDLWRLHHLSVDGGGRTVTASGLLAWPAKPAGRRSPVLGYQHATIFRDADAPSNRLGPDEPTAVLASLGFGVVASDYVGYGSTRGLPHPYLQAAPTAAAVVDLLTAARTWRQRNGVAGNGQLFLAGYSEGGYATVAAHRRLQAEGSVHAGELVGVFPGAGPYDVQATLDGLLARVRDEVPLLGALITPGLLRRLGDAGRAELRRLLVRAVVPDDADVVIDAAFIDAYLDDDRARIAARHSVHDWAPAAPVQLFHGRDDRTVPYASSTSTLAAMRARGAPAVTLADCRAIPADHLPCVPDYFSQLLAALALTARDL